MSTPPATEPAPTPAPLRAPYERPVLEPLGRWSALTLQQTVPLTPV